MNSSSTINHLLAKSEYIGPAVSPAVVDHPLVAWMSKVLKFEEQFLPESSIAAQSFLNPGFVSGKEHGDDSLLSQLLHDNIQYVFPYDCTSDIASVADQSSFKVAPPLYHLDSEEKDKIADILLRLQEERILLKSQIISLESLEGSLDKVQKESRNMWHSKVQEHDNIKKCLDFEISTVSELCSLLNRLISRMHKDWSDDMCLLVQQEHEHWLLSIGSREKEAYLLANCETLSDLTRITRQMDGTLCEEKTKLMPSVQDPDWLCSNDPFTILATKHQLREECLDVVELELMLHNSMRVCSATGQAEKASLEARLDFAQHTAELDTVRHLLRERIGLSVAIYNDEVQESQLKDQVQGLQSEEKQLLVVYHSIVDDLQKANSMHILKGRYELQVQVQAVRLHQRALLIRSLMSHSSQLVIVHKLHELENYELQALYFALKGLGVLDKTLLASQTRLAEYSLSLPQTQLDGFLAQIESISTNAPKVSASGSLAATQEQCKNALLKVSDFLFSKFGQNAALNRETFHSSFGLISTGQGQNSASIALHAKDIEAKLFDLRTTAFNMNELLNAMVTDNDRFHVYVSNHKEEQNAERSVLEWFHLSPERLTELVTSIEHKLTQSH